MWWLGALVGGVVFAAAAAVEWQYQCSARRIETAGNPADVSFTRFMSLLCLVFDRKAAGWRIRFCDAELPMSVRVILLRVTAKLLGINLQELKEPLEAFRTIGDFFRREIREDAREICSCPGAVSSPVDAEVLALGTDNKAGARVAQVSVKRTTFSLPGLLGVDPAKGLEKGRVLMYAVLHLGPGDYHRFHAPAEFIVHEGRRFAGEGLPVSSLLTSFASDIFSVNERVVLSGEWQGGGMHLVAVGASHVRGIFLTLDERLSSGLAPTDGRSYLDGQITHVRIPEGSEKVRVAQGDTVGGFRLGSGFVIVFEAPEGSEWCIGAGDRVRMGQQLVATPLRRQHPNEPKHATVWAVRRTSAGNV